MYIYEGKIINVVDGDTMDVEVDLGFSTYQLQRFRLIAKSDKKFDAPETWRPKTKAEKEHGLKAKQFVLDLISEDNSCIIASVKVGKYRYVAQLAINNQDLGDLLIANGFRKHEIYLDE